MDTLSPEALFILVSFFFTFLFGVIVLLYLFGPTPKKVVTPDEETTPKVQDRFKAIMEIVDNPKSDTKALQEASGDFFTYYDKMELSDYKKKAFLFALVVHKHATHEIIINADTLLRKLNPDLEYELTKTLNRALDARGI